MTLPERRNEKGHTLQKIANRHENHSLHYSWRFLYTLTRYLKIKDHTTLSQVRKIMYYGLYVLLYGCQMSYFWICYYVVLVT